MVQLSQSPLRRPSPSCHSEEGEEKSMKPDKQQVTQGPRGDNQPPMSPLQAALNSAATASQAYETYIDNGLICLKHKIRNIEKKKLKLEDYRDRLKRGEVLNQDQLEAVEKYEEVIHNLDFAKELQKTFSGLSQELLKAQRKAQRRETLLKLEAEKKKLRTILQVQYVLQNFTQEHVQKDFRSGLNGAIYLPSKELDYLIKFAKLTCSGRNETVSIEDQMEQSSLCFWDLLEGSEKVVVGTTYKHLKDLLSKLIDSGYFENIPTPCNKPEKEELKEEMLEKPKQLSKPEFVNEIESQRQHVQSEIQPQEFLNRRYLPEVDCTVKPERAKHWEIEHVPKSDPPKSWEMLVDVEEEEQKRRNPESLKSLESVNQEGKKKLELSQPWESTLPEVDDHKQDVPKPWVAPVREEQASSKSWVTKEKEQQEPKQEGPKPWITKTKGGLEQNQEKPKIWVSQTNMETLKKPEPMKPWDAHVRDEMEQKKQQPEKPWVGHIGEEDEQKSQPPKVWETSERSQQVVQQPLQNPPKIWGVGNLVPKDQTELKKLDGELKERQEYRSKLESDVKKGGKTGGINEHSNDASKKKGSFPSIGESCKLPRNIQNVMQVAKPVHQTAAEFCSTSSLPKDPVLRREKLQDLMTQIQGTYNFMQESLLDFDKPSQSAGCSSQASSVDSSASNEQLSSQNDFPEQSVQSASSPVTLHGSNTSLVSDNTLSGSETELHSPQVFKVNAPLPPRREQESKENSLHSTGYNQNFSTASTQTPPPCKLPSTQNAEQTTFSQESLSNGTCQVEGVVPVSNGTLTFYAAQTATFPRPSQPFIGNRGSIRGSLRGVRSMNNSYRSSGGYKAGFEPYRGSPSIPNGTYSQLLPGRDYSSVQYSQRDMNYQPNYKRGGINSGRTNSRGYRQENRQEENCSAAGWNDSSQVSSPERDNEMFNSGETGQGDSRSITPVDIPVTSQAATLLPVHVYPLPQQMRVAFSAARTSNLAPGTLDQPIVFDLLLNNLGETFDIQLGRFNCPVNGTYVFIFHMLKLAVNVPLYVNLMKNEEVLVSAYANDGAPDHETASNHAVLQLFQGDQIWLRLHRGAIYGSSWKYSTFSGYLLYQD
ncbi:caprin-2 [Ahaetulla prasina]|uniref:caprin-2 n=1 Tax=Ahaetulla prasina TaxID=499056 RepID=UPI002647D4E1|nr:caprin-2 [Ahaetulla prasina]